MIQMITGYWVSQCISVAAKLRIADRIKDAPKSYQLLAEETAVSSEALYRVLRALASVGIFAETEAGIFSLTPMADYLRTDVPLSLQAMAVMMGEPEHYQSWGDLYHSVKTGQPAFDHRFGCGVFDFLREHPTSAQIFEDAMNSFSAVELQAIAPAYDFSQFSTIVDVGGGYGAVLAEILPQYPQIKGILFDEEYVVSQARPTLGKYGAGDRIECVAGNFFESIPAGGDAYILKHIIHDWDDARSIQILSNCSRVMTNDSKILVMEQVVPEGNTPSSAKMLDINMLVMCQGGKERTGQEFTDLFNRSGLHLNRIIPTKEEICILEGTKI